MLISIDQEKCKHDGICVLACGRRIIEMPDKKFVPKMIAGQEDSCIVCGHCVAACSSGALSHQKIPLDECVPLEKELNITRDQAEQFLKARRSTRTYRDKPVERDKLAKLVEMAGYAPSGHNARPVQWIVIEKTEEVRRLTGIVIDWMRQLIKESPPMAELVGAEEKVQRWENGIDSIARHAPHLIIAHAPKLGVTPHEDCVLSLSYTELAAASLGLGTTWCGYFMIAALLCDPFIQELNLPKSHKSFGIMAVGQPKFKFHRIPVRNSIPVEWR